MGSMRRQTPGAPLTEDSGWDGDRSEPFRGSNSSSTAIVLGAQWGDEGKGKVVDALAREMDLVVRFQGGANAGHTVRVGEDRFVFHLLPSGVLHRRPKAPMNIIANGCVVDLVALAEEVEHLGRRDIRLTPDNLAVSDRAHAVIPAHRFMDRRQGLKIGTTGRGIGPAFADKANRRGIRLESLLDGTFKERVEELTETCSTMAEQLLGVHLPDRKEDLEALWAAAEQVRPFVTDTRSLIGRAVRSGAAILYEGGQGALLDLDHGTYPFVTSSSTCIGGAYTGGGVYLEFRRRIAVVKAYTTRVGNGPFPTEQDNSTGDRLREIGCEIGATTGRPRRCGWLDLHLLRGVFEVNGFNEIALTKLDCLTGVHPVFVAVGREENGQPRYVELEGWTEPVDTARRFDQLPLQCRRYVEFIESFLEVPVTMVSVGPRRDQIITRDRGDVARATHERPGGSP